MDLIYRNEGGTPLCCCGCGATATKLGGFRQGHDARLKGTLQKLHLANEELSLFDDKNALVYTLPARDWAILRGWEKYIDRHASVVSNRTEKEVRRRAVREGNRATPTSTVLPWEDVLKMKEAIKRVNAEGFKGVIRVNKHNFQRILDAEDLQAVFEELA
jgi:hypothetical protein